jgi:hypothetical protein
MATAGTNAKVEITTELLSGDLPRDWITNSFSFNTTGTGLSDSAWQALVDAIATQWFVTSTSNFHYGACGGKIVAYDRADAEPRPEKAAHIYAPGSWQTLVECPRQVALCVSFYSGRNLARTRGRVYLAIPNNQFGEGDRPSATTLTAAIGLVKGINVVVNALTPVWWQTVHSTVSGEDNIVTNYWCNDVYDTQRRRAPKESTRQTATFP